MLYKEKDTSGDQDPSERRRTSKHQAKKESSKKASHKMFDDGGDREKSQSQIVAVGEVLSFIQLTVTSDPMEGRRRWRRGASVVIKDP